MTSLKTIAAAALLSAFTVTLVFAQAAIGEPGAYALYHPDRDVLNEGAPEDDWLRNRKPLSTPMRKRQAASAPVVSSTTAPMTADNPSG